MTAGFAICSCVRCLKDLGNCCIAGLQTGVFTNPHNGRGSPLCWGLVIQQETDAGKNDLTGVVEGNFIGALKVLTLEVQVSPANHDLQVFRDFLLLLFGRCGLQFRKNGLSFLALLVFIGQRWLRHLGVVLRQALLGTELRVMLESNADKHVGVVITHGDPVGAGSWGRLILGKQR